MGKGAKSKSKRVPRRQVAVSAADRAAAAAAERLNRGDVRGAMGIIEPALQAAPQHPDLLHLAGQVMLMHGAQERGRALVEQAVGLAPRVALYRMTLGSVCAVDEQFERALEHFQNAVRLAPDEAEAHTNVGITLVRLGRREAAARAFANAVRLDSSNPQAYLNLAICSMELQRMDEAENAIRNIEPVLDKPTAEILREVGNVYRALGQHVVAQDYYRRALSLDDQDARVWFALGDVLSTTGDIEQAEKALRKAEALDYPVAALKLAQSRMAASRGNIETAKRLLAEGEIAASDDYQELTRIATQYSLIGDFKAQETCLRRVLALDPENASAFFGLVSAPGRSLSDDEVRTLRGYAEDSGVDVDTRRRIGFSLGNHFHYAKRYDESFSYFQLGNRSRGYRFDWGAYSQWISRIETLFGKPFFAERAEWGSASTLPLLVVGMPRSGTTLTEQIVSSHPSIFGAGEYGKVASLAGVEGLDDPDFRVRPDMAATLGRDAVAHHAQAYLARMEKLAVLGESHVSNKLPHNFEQLGLFGLLFPNAPVIHIKRDPRDNLLSIYFQDFSSTHEYAYDLKTLGRYYRLYERLVAHWLAVIPNPVYELQYEDLVAELPTKARELADFVGVDWDERMLRFYEQERMVQTASKWQVRQKLYTTSVARWKPYEKHLKPMFDALDANA